MDDLNISYKIIDDMLYVEYYAPYVKKKFLYKLKKPSQDFKFTLFKTATTGMRVLKDKKGNIFLEKLCVDGHLRLLPYKGINFGQLNFVNIGWRKGNIRKYIRIDVYTGEYLIIEDRL